MEKLEIYFEILATISMSLKTWLIQMKYYSINKKQFNCQVFH